MLLRINKKIFFYFFLFIFLGTLNNKNFYNFELPKINKIDVIGLDKKQKKELLEKLNFVKLNNLFFLDDEQIIKILDSINLIDEYFVFKKYPSSLKIETIKVQSLAYTKKKGNIFILGSNGKLLKNVNKNLNIPFIFGDFENENFFKLKKTIQESKLNYSNIRNLYSFKSGRWDIETLSGILIKLPINETKKNLDFCFEILNDDRFKDVKMIDLRQNQKLIINE